MWAMSANALRERIPWVRRRRWQEAAHRRSEILPREIDHLPGDGRDRIARPRHRRRSQPFSDDSQSLEMAADEICAALAAEHLTAEGVFRARFVTRHPFYADT